MPTFDCDKFGYVLSSRTLTQVNFNTGARTTISTIVGTDGGFINAIGFNKLDNYIYAIITDPLLDVLLGNLLGGNPGSWLMRIAKNGNWDVLPYRIDSTSITMGDVDDVGRFWVSESGKKWFSIDVKPGSATFGSVLKSGTSPMDLISGVGDWAFVPGSGNYLYSVQFSVIESGLASTNIVKWNLDTNKWELHRKYSLLQLGLSLTWGAVFGTSDGLLYAQDNLLGGTYKFAIKTAASPVAIPGGSILNLSGDGARCINAAA
ncbi:hypothetical protein ACHAPT_010375 [Fusarium lateritium]